MSRGLLITAACCLLAVLVVPTQAESGIEFDAGARGILEEFYVALDGPGWDNRTGWLTDAHFCTWYGITCDPNNNSSITEINLDRNGLNGQMKFSIGNLRDLVKISMAENDILGRLPPTLSRCTGLKFMNFSHNLLDSVIPPQYGVLDRLEVLDLGQNSLQGSIPSSIGDYGGLIYLDLAENRLTGEIPLTLGNLAEVQFINISFNSLTGWIPEMGERMDDLKQLDLSHNNLNGMVPSSLQDIRNLKYIDISHNEIKVFEEFDKFDEEHIECDFSHNEFVCPLSERAVACKASCERHSTPIPGTAVAAVFALVLGLTAGIVFVSTLEKQRLREESGVVEDEDDF